MLSFAQPGQQNHLAARELDRVMLFVGIVYVDLPEPGDALAQLAGREETQGMIAFNVTVEGELGAWKDANRYFSRCRKVCASPVGC